MTTTKKIAMTTKSTRSSAEATLRRAAAFVRTVKADHIEHAGVDPQRPLPPLYPDVLGDAVPSGGDGELDADSAAKRIEKTIWGSPAGKKRLAPRLVKLIPTHKTYVEPFAGSAAVFFAKQPASKEVLADADPEIAFAYQALSKLTRGELTALKKKDWTGSRKRYRALQKAEPRNRLEKLYKFLYLSNFSYAHLRGRGFNPAADGAAGNTINRIKRYHHRLRDVIVRGAHYADVVKEFDGKDTFFFLDPPYLGGNVWVGEDKFSEQEFRKVLDGIKGKFLCTYGTKGELDTSGFHVRKIRTRRSIHGQRGDRGSILTQLLISNYAMSRKSLEPFEFEDVAAVDLSVDAAADIDLLGALVSALAKRADSPAIRSLVYQIDQLDDATGEGVAVLAQELLPIGQRLVSAIAGTLPDLADAIRSARPAIEVMAKTVTPRASRRQASGTRGRQRRSDRDPREPGKDSGPLAIALAKRIPLLKTGEERYVLGIVLEPETVDAQGDIYSAETIRSAAHKFMADYQHVGLMHKGLIDGRVKILESYLAPMSFELDGSQVKKGTWLLAVRVLDDDLWAQIKNGELTGLSMGGSAVSSPEARGGSEASA